MRSVPGLTLLRPADANETIAAWRKRWPPHKPLLPYGHRASFAVLSREALTTEAAAKLAWDVACYDQQGCLSPQAAYTEDGGETAPETFAGWVAEALGCLARRFPCQRDFAGSAAVQRDRSLATFSEGTRLWHDGSPDWTVCLAPPGPFPFSCGCRFLYIVPFREMDEIAPVLRDAAPALEAAGLAAPPHRREAFSDMLAACGVSRICPVGRMQTPPLAWHHNGQPLLGRLIRWIDREEEA